MHDASSRIRGLRATRAYTTDPISDEDLATILNAGRWAGSSLNSQGWTFVVVRDPNMKTELSEAGRFSLHLASAAAVVVLVGAAGRGEFDIGRAAQNMMLAADAMGIGSCPATLHDEETVRQLLDVPAGRPARHAIAFGHPDTALEPVIRQNIRAITGHARKPLEDVVRWERFA